MRDRTTSSALHRMLLILGAAWIIAYLWSISILIWSEPTGDGFTRGLNRVAGFFGWQLAAGAVALVIFLLGRRLPKGGARWLSRVPILLAMLPVLAIAGLLIYSWVIQMLYPPEGYVPPTKPATTLPAEPVPAD